MFRPRAVRAILAARAAFAGTTRPRRMSSRFPRRQPTPTALRRLLPRSVSCAGGALLLRLDRRIEIRSRLSDQLRAKNASQLVRLDFLDFALLDVAELERTIGNTNEPIDPQSKMFEHPAHLAVLAFAQRNRQPDVGALLAVEHRGDGAVVNAGDRDAAAQAVERVLADTAQGAHTVAPLPTGGGKLERPREPAVVGEQQQALAVQIQPTDADETRQPLRQPGKERRPPLR